MTLRKILAEEGLLKKASPKPNPNGSFAIGSSGDGSWKVTLGKKQDLRLRDALRLFKEADRVRDPVLDAGTEFGDEGDDALRKTTRILGFMDSFETHWHLVDEETGDYWSWMGTLEYERRNKLSDFD